MPAKLICRLLLVLLFGMVGCSARRSALPATYESRQTEDALLRGQLREGQKAEADFNEALTLIAELRYSQARGKLLLLLETLGRTGERNRAAEATFWVGYCYEKEGQHDEAANFYNRVVRAYPGTSASHQATERLSRLAIQTGP